MPQFINFYENIQEARLRLLNSVVCYDGQPCFVHWIAEHTDGRFRIYVEFFGDDDRGTGRDRFPDFPDRNNHYENGYAKALDDWIKERGDSCPVQRKYMSAAGFNKYRPFPLGNVNFDGKVIYVERRPTRQTLQGIRQDSVFQEEVSISPSTGDKTAVSLKSLHRVGIYSPEFVDCVTNSYPSYAEVVEHLRKPDCGNAGVAFHRSFSVLRGPVKTLFLCYKTEGVGCIGVGNGLILDSSYEHLKEEIEELNVFPYINFG